MISWYHMIYLSLSFVRAMVVSLSTSLSDSEHMICLVKRHRCGQDDVKTLQPNGWRRTSNGFKGDAGLIHGVRENRGKTTTYRGDPLKLSWSSLVELVRCK